MFRRSTKGPYFSIKAEALLIIMILFSRPPTVLFYISTMNPTRKLCWPMVLRLNVRWLIVDQSDSGTVTCNLFKLSQEKIKIKLLFLRFISTSCKIIFSIISVLKEIGRILLVKVSGTNIMTIRLLKLHRTI